MVSEVHLKFPKFAINFRASGRLRKKKVKFCGIFRGKFAEKKADFAGIFEASFAEKRLVLRTVDFVGASEQTLLESDWFCADLRN